MQRKQIDTPFQIKSVSTAGEFDGYGSVFGVIDTYGDVVEKGAFLDSLADWRKKARWPALLWQHSSDEPIGVYEDMYEDDIGLYVKGRLLIDDDPLAKRAHGHLKAGSITGLSIGITVPKDGYVYDSKTDICHLIKVNLWEVSPVTFPANDAARVRTVKSVLRAGDFPDVRTLEHILRDAGFSQKQAKAFISGGYSAVTHRDDEGDVSALKAALNSWKF